MNIRCKVRTHNAPRHHGQEEKQVIVQLQGSRLNFQVNPMHTYLHMLCSFRPVEGTMNILYRFYLCFQIKVLLSFSEIHQHFEVQTFQKCLKISLVIHQLCAELSSPVHSLKCLLFFKLININKQLSANCFFGTKEVVKSRDQGMQ